MMQSTFWITLISAALLVNATPVFRIARSAAESYKGGGGGGSSSSQASSISSASSSSVDRGSISLEDASNYNSVYYGDGIHGYYAPSGGYGSIIGEQPLYTGGGGGGSGGTQGGGGEGCGDVGCNNYPLGPGGANFGGDYPSGGGSSGTSSGGGGGSYGGSSANSYSSSFGGSGLGVPGFFPSFDGGFSGGGYPPIGGSPFEFHNFLQRYFQQLQDYHRQIAAQAAAGASNDVSSNTGAHAYASGELGPRGGWGTANISPPAKGGVEARFGDTSQPSSGPVNSASGSFPAPSGSGTSGIFTSSSSGSQTIDGKTKSFKTSSVSVNDNGKVTTYTAHDP